MENSKENVIEKLNSLIEINNDRIDGYEKAAVTENDELKSFFEEQAGASLRFRNELVDAVVTLDGRPAEGTTTSGKVYRAWMAFKTSLTGKDAQGILNSCEFGEDAALEAYEEVLSTTTLSANLSSMIKRQHEAIEQAHDKVKSMRDSHVFEEK